MDRVNEVTKEVFNALAQIRRTDERSQPLPEMLHQRMRSFVERAMRAAQEHGFDAKDSQDIGFALVALTDEVVMAKGGELRDHWVNRQLQLAFFNTTRAGEEFFERLQAIQMSPQRMEVLKVYYLCMLFGFQGTYRVQQGGQVALDTLHEQVGGMLSRAGLMGDAVLSPQAARPNERLGGSQSNLPIIAVSLVAVLLAVILYVFFRFSVSSQASSLIEHVNEENPAATTAQPEGD
jgi:type VI secretion system protein ImpK